MTDPGERLYAVACAGMFVFGMMLGLPGTVLGQSETVAQFGLTLADRGLLIATLFAGLLVGSFLSGALVDSLGQRLALVVSSLLVAVALPLLASASAWRPWLPRPLRERRCRYSTATGRSGERRQRPGRRR